MIGQSKGFTYSDMKRAQKEKMPGSSCKNRSNHPLDQLNFQLYSRFITRQFSLASGLLLHLIPGCGATSSLPGEMPAMDPREPGA